MNKVCIEAGLRLQKFLISNKLIGKQIKDIKDTTIIDTLCRKY